MADIRGPADEHPSWVRHFLVTAVGILCVTLLVMLRSLAGEWFSAVEAIDGPAECEWIESIGESGDTSCWSVRTAIPSARSYSVNRTTSGAVPRSGT
jgi:hypothetical protein